MGAYYTIFREGEGVYREKMSRFLSFVMHVESAEEALEKIKAFQNRYHDARHVCWAYMLGPAREIWQINDNGEPSGTAGKPILGQINSKNLTDVLVVVVRYFGGIKLGTSGLISAYKEAARLAIESTSIEECHEMREMEAVFSYMDMDGVMRVIKGENLEILEKKFDNLCEVKLRVRADEYEKIKKMLESRGGKIED